jgi:hypothetical protein
MNRMEMRADPRRSVRARSVERPDISTHAEGEDGAQIIHTTHSSSPQEDLTSGSACSVKKPESASELVVMPARLRLETSAGVDGNLSKPWKFRRAVDVGFVIFGPILFLFYAWLVRHPAMRRIQHLYFLSREGYLLEQLHSLVLQRFPQLELPAGSYFHTSRRVALCAAQAVCFSPNAISAGMMFQGTVRDLLRHRLGLEFEGESAVVDWNIRLPRDGGKLQATLEALRPLIVGHAIQERQKLLDYARQSGMLKPGFHGVVDIGYSATIQKGLQIALSTPLFGFYMATFDSAKAVQDQGGEAFGCLAEGISPFASHEPVLRAPLFMEAFLTAPHGQVTGFHEEKDWIAPRFKATPYTAHETSILLQMQSGALEYCSELLEIHGSDLLYANLSEGPPQEFFRMVIEGALVLPDDVLDMLHVEDEFCGNGQIQVSLG